MGGGGEGKCHLAYEKQSDPSDLHRIRQTTVTNGRIFVRQTQFDQGRLLDYGKQAVTGGSNVHVQLVFGAEFLNQPVLLVWKESSFSLGRLRLFLCAVLGGKTLPIDGLIFPCLWHDPSNR